MAITSKLRLWSLGKAVENKAEGSWELKVKPIEVTLGADGEITSNASESVVEGVDSTGRPYSDKAANADYVTATWYGMQSGNQITPPDMRRGTEVLIYRVGESNVFYWTPRDKRLVNVETVKYAWGASEDNAKERTPKNSYFLTMDPRRKKITFTTSTANGEKTAYAILLDPGTGRFIFQDDTENQISIDSITHSIVLGTSQDAVLQLVKKDFNLILPGNYKVTAKGTVSVEADGIIGLTSKTAIDLTAPKIGLNGATAIKGAATASGSLVVDGAVSSKTSVTAPNLR